MSEDVGAPEAASVEVVCEVKWWDSGDEVCSDEARRSKCVPVFALDYGNVTVKQMFVVPS